MKLCLLSSHANALMALLLVNSSSRLFSINLCTEQTGTHTTTCRHNASYCGEQTRH